MEKIKAKMQALRTENDEALETIEDLKTQLKEATGRATSVRGCKREQEHHMCTWRITAHNVTEGEADDIPPVQTTACNMKMDDAVRRKRGDGYIHIHIHLQETDREEEGSERYVCKEQGQRKQAAA